MALPTNTTNDTPAEDTHPALHNDVNTEVNRIDEELGDAVVGTYDTVTERLAVMETPRNDPRAFVGAGAPPAAIPGSAVLYAIDSGGKVALWVRFPTGAPIKLAQEA